LAARRIYCHCNSRRKRRHEDPRNPAAQGFGPAEFPWRPKREMKTYLNQELLEVCWLGRMDYQAARNLQESLAIDRAEGLIPDTLLLLEHPHTITLGRRGKEENLLCTREQLAEEGIAVYRTDRGGDVTYHGPGQLVGYPVVNLRNRAGRVGGYLRDLERMLILTLVDFGLAARTMKGFTGVWIDNEKIAAIGIRVNSKGISGHGFALNVATDLTYFDRIVPCGIVDKGVTSLERILSRPVPLLDVASKVAGAFSRVFGSDQSLPKPPWIRVRLPSGETYAQLKALIHGKSLHTVCEEARCPNMAECWGCGTATFMILGDVCTRNCCFCAVKHGTIVTPSKASVEPLQVAQAVASMGLRHVVITSVTRDDLPDGGASVFAETICRVRRLAPNCSIEVLIPDFKGDQEALAAVLKACPEILGHNIETVPRLYEIARPQAKYRRSLQVLQLAKALNTNCRTKSGIMVGMGETWDEIVSVMQDLREVHCDILTIGQYLRPSKAHLPVERYYTPDEFANLKHIGCLAGFSHVESGPLVRSSYHASGQAQGINIRKDRGEECTI